ncbi:hypothetical protein CCAX7_000650 [Capsulimonas corticalis]|uniref:Uncharacterized protein n=1 Tax=Capsulimonas corticalis TaxID=2219043 RepID=A0A402CR81_9BACT|nr:hypothetical protein [Capsulimonas corticalis]BDI28014.1 hypothetical protein CCAX7_000650 [Capsulimonas corticalis]
MRRSKPQKPVIDQPLAPPIRIIKPVLGPNEKIVLTGEAAEILRIATLRLAMGLMETHPVEVNAILDKIEDEMRAAEEARQAVRGV